MSHSRIAAVLIAVLLLAAARSPAAESFVVIVNAANSATMTRDEIADVFMKRITRWSPSGAPIVVVDELPSSPARQEFSRVVLRRGVEAMEAYWQQQIFSGRDVPPVVKETDDDVLAFVRRNPGAIGYVSAGANLDGVRAVRWK